MEGQAKIDDEQDAVAIVPGLESRFGECLPAINSERLAVELQGRKGEH